MEEKFFIQDNNSYIEYLINQTFSILPLYEEYGYCLVLTQKIDNLYRKMNGFFSINEFDPIITIDIISFINELKNTENTHADVRSCVLTSCSLLSSLKVVTEE